MTSIINPIVERGEITLIGGAGQAGKTTLLMQILAQIQNNEPVLGRYSSKGDFDVIYIAADRTWRSYAITAQATGLDLNRLSVKALIDDPDFNHIPFEKDPFNYFRVLLDQMLPKVRRHTTVVVDPLIIWLGCDTNRYHMVASRLIMMNKLCNEFDITLFGSHHATKARTDVGFKRAQDRLSGSAALTGFTSTQLFLSTPEEVDNEEGLSELTIMSHHAPPETIWLGRDDNGCFFISSGPSKGKTLEDRIMDILLKSPKTRNEIITALAPLASPATIDRAIKKLKSAGTVHTPSYGVVSLVDAP